jgi:hypothetical protein
MFGLEVAIVSKANEYHTWAKNTSNMWHVQNVVTVVSAMLVNS